MGCQREATMLLASSALLLLWPSAMMPAAARTMATLPAGSVEGVAEALTVTEDLTQPGAPIVFEGASGARFELPKSGELQVPADPSAVWGDGDPRATAILNEQADTLGNAILWRDGSDPTYAEIAALGPPLLASQLRCGDFDLTGQTFIGSRIAAEKRSFDWTGNNMDMRQDNHFNRSQLLLNATRSGLLGGYLPAPRWYWPQGARGWVEQIHFAVPESTDDFPFDSHSIQPIWARYINVTAVIRTTT